MKLKSFKEFMNEMARDTGINGSTFDRTNEWNSVIKYSKFTKLLRDNLGTNRYKVFQYGSETYYLTDEHNGYLGHIELEDSHIVSSFSKLKGGFYNIMFTFILTQIPYIISDNKLSSQAVRSYEKLNLLPAKKFKMYIIPNDNIKDKLEFNKDTLLKDMNNRVMITEKQKNEMIESIENYFGRINKFDPITGYPKSLTKFYNERHEICDLYLFNEYISLINEGYLDWNTEVTLQNFIKNNVPNNKHPIIKGTPRTIKVGYINNFDNYIWFDISNILDISKNKEAFIKYFDKIPLDERDYILYWKSEQIN